MSSVAQQLAQGSGIVSEAFVISLGILQALLFMWLGWITARIAQVARESKDLHRWHQPDEHGTQEWKNPHIREAMEANTQAIKQLHGEIRGLREDFRGLAADLETHGKREELVFSSLADKLADLRTTLDKIHVNPSR